MKIEEFQEVVWDFYREHGRDLPWREPEPDGSFDAYKIWVSEIMLQQTQVPRVIPKYKAFLERFPTAQVLAAAQLAEVLVAWNGLGYNRRAKFLWQAAQEVTSQYEGEPPADVTELVKLPGIGKNTAAAIAVYAYNQPHVFIETNIRTVFIHHFFADADNIDDKELLPLITESLDNEHPREWYWALMDYGSFLKKSVGNVSRASKHFTKQSAFHGSLRQIRGFVVRELSTGQMSEEELFSKMPDDRLSAVLGQLVQEGMVKQGNKRFYL